MSVARSESNELVPADKLSDRELIKRAIEEYEAISADEKENRQNGLDDLKFKIGEQWPAEPAQQRTSEGRALLTINQLPQFIKEVVNDQRQRRPQIKISTGENGNPDTTKVYDGLVRDIQYCSSAGSIYDSALENAVSNGFGYFRILTEYCDDKSFDQKITMQRIRNPFTVYYGACTNLDGSDVDTVFVTSWMKTADFHREHPKANAVSWESASESDRTTYSSWIRKNEIRVAERFSREKKKKTLLMIKKVPGVQVEGPDIMTIYQGDPVPQGYAFTMKDGKQVKRTAIIEEIWWHKLTAYDVLDEKKLDGKYIPIVPVWGEETDVEGRVYRSGLIRFAKDPARSYNYWFSTATELVALAPKAPYIGAEGQFKGHEEQWRQANRIAYPYLEYVPKSLGGMLSPPPARQPFAEMPQGVMNMILIAREDLRTTTGKYQRAEIAPRGPEQSGSALLQEKQKGELSSFNYVDNLARAIEFAGKIIVDLIPHIYDREMRKVLVRKEDNETDYVTINNPNGKRDVRKGDYNVVVSVGPGYSTRRQESSAAKLEFMRNLPPDRAALIADLLPRGMDWEDADRIANRLKATLPPEIKALEGEEGDKALEDLPQAARDAVLNERSIRLQTQGELEKYQKALREAAKQLDDKNAILATDRYKTDAANAAKMAAAELSAAVKLATDESAKQTGVLAAEVANITAAFGQVSGYVDELRKREQALAAAEAKASQQAAAGPVPAVIDPATAAGSASPKRGM